MNRKHTPGPWHVISNEHEPDHRYCFDMKVYANTPEGLEFTGAVVHATSEAQGADPDHVAARKANARAISALPELLVAAKTLAALMLEDQTVAPNRDDCLRAMAAVCKAEYSPEPQAV